VERHFPPKFVFRIVLLYACAALLWLLVSDEIVGMLAVSVSQATWLGLAKGTFSILASSVFLYLLLRSFSQRLIKYAESSREAAARYQTLFEHSRDAMLVVNSGDGRVLKANGAALEMYGFSHDQLVSRSLADLQAEAPAELQGAFRDEGSAWHRRAGGERFPVEVSMNPLTRGQAPVMLVTVRDISRQIARHVTLDRIAHQDALTGLPNRLMMVDLQRIAMAQARRTGSLLAVCFVDLDGFKEINDKFGHEAGDEVLRQMAGRMQSQVRAGDSVIRLGGDEFVLLVGQINTLGECEAVLRRVLKEMARPLEFDGQAAHVTASIGVAVFPGDGDDTEALLGFADEAMYRAKAEGKNRFAFYNAAHEQRVKARGELLDRVTRAMRASQLSLWYQPVVNLSTGRVESVEALLRWLHPVLGLLPAAEFLPFVTEPEVELALDLWVLDQVRVDREAWATVDVRCPVRVNLFASPAHLPALTEGLGVLARDLPKNALTVEIGARGMSLGDTAFDNLASACHALGIRLSLDGIVAGCDSVHSLVTRSLDEIKFSPGVLGINASGEGDTTLVRAYIRLGAGIGRQVVAKEVHAEAQLRCLRALGCPMVQGIALSPPVSPAGVPDVVARIYEWTDTEVAS